MGGLQGDTVLVTGASRGLGRSMALRFSEEGAYVVLVSRSRDGLEEVAEETDGETLVATADVRNSEDVCGVVDASLERFGRIDTLVNNAGVGLLTIADGQKPVIEVSEEEWDTVMETNLKGVFLFCRYAVPGMIERGRGNVINVSSGYGRRAAPNWAPYVTSKWGLEGFTRCLAMELEDDGVMVNAIDPGGRVRTRFWDHVDDQERLIEPDAMNDAALLLARQGSDGVTGQSTDADEWERRLS
jgi:3-oxoacyl-[acyl-carrier protein] reductase